jgi:hypothetical protein
MGNTNTRTRTTVRRIAAFLALLGALVMSSGVALMATAATADATQTPTLKDWVCKYVGTPGINERLKHGNEGLVWVSTSATQGSYFADGANRSYVLLKNAPHDPEPSASQCPQPDNDWATADVQWTEPSCENGNEADYVTSGDHVTWTVVSGSATPGSSIELKAEAVSPHEFEHGDDDTRVFKHKFDKAEVCRDAAASVEVTQPTCGNENTPSFEASGSHVTWEVLEQDLTPGGHVTVKFTADAGHEFPDHSKTKVITEYFDDAEDCTAYDATASVEWVEPSCENQNTPNYLPTGEHVSWAITDGSLTPDGDVEVTATADEGHAFDNESTTKVFTHHFDVAEICEIVNPPREVTPADPTFVDPTCDTDPGLTLPQQEVVVDERSRQAVGPVVGTSDADGIHYVATGDPVSGGTVEVDATLIDPETTFFGEGATTHWSHTFPVPEGCTSVSPPTVTPPTSATQDATDAVVTPTVVEAGLAGSVTEDLRARQGLALVVAGMVLLMAAGGLGLVRQRR